MQAQQMAESSIRSNHVAGKISDDDILLTSKQTRDRVGGVTTMCIWRWMRDERVQFPQPIKINRHNYWRLGDLRRWQSGRVQKVVV